MNEMATTQNTGFVISRIARIMAEQTPSEADGRALSLKVTRRKLKRSRSFRLTARLAEHYLCPILPTT